jgi:hypothetical protein
MIINYMSTDLKTLIHLLHFKTEQQVHPLDAKQKINE